MRPNKAEREMTTAVERDLELVPCPGCGGERFATRFEGGNPTLDPTLKFRIVRCDDCGLHYTNPRPTLATLGRYYPSNYSPYQSEEKPAAGEGGTIQNLVLRDAFGAPAVRPSAGGRAMAKLIRLVRPPESFGFGVSYRGRGRLLDFGCGSGKFLRRMHALGWNVTGIDFSEEVRAVTASGLRAVHGTLPHPQLGPGSFDVVTLRHALEHVPDPRATLRDAWNLLDGGGLLLVAVPNYEAWEIARLGEAAMGLDLPRHLTHFTPATLAAMMRGQGLTEVRLRQKSRASWIRKAAKRAKDGGVLKLSAAARIAAALAQMRGRGNELIATAVKP
jgi:SAM-dependent methyltransferase